MNLAALKENILKGFYQEHPQGKQLLDVDLCDMFSKDALAIEDLEDYSAKLEESKDEEIDNLKKDIEEYSRDLENSDRANDKLESEITFLKKEIKRINRECR